MRQWFNGDRRSFIRALAGGGIGAIGCAIAFASTAGVGIITSLWPATRRSTGGGDTGDGADGMIAVAPISLVPEDGTPRSFPIIADRVDAWTRSPGQVVGGVFLRRLEDGSIEALTVICPHAGCTIHYQTGDEGGKYFCPCHNASFALSGEKIGESNPSPRKMDTLEAAVVDGMVMVRFENFRHGTSKKVVVS